MATRTKKTAVIDPNSVAITDFCQTQGINEQIFRLELMQHCDDADSTKTCDFDVAQSVAAVLLSQAKTLPSSESLTPQDLQPSQETAPGVPQKPQNTAMAVSGSNAVSTTATGANIPTALSELINKSQEDIELFDLVQIYRNEQIIQNARTRDSELVAQLREQRLENRALVFDSLRDLNARQPIPQDLPELPSALSEEIKSLSDELGKKLAA